MRMRRACPLGFPCLVICVLACNPAPADRAGDTLAAAQPADTAAVRRAIDSTVAGMAAAVNRQDMAGMAQGLAEDYVSLEDVARPVRGRSAYRAVVDAMAAAGTFHDLAYEAEGLDVSGDLAVRYGRWRSKYLPKGADTVRFAGNFVHVWRRQPDGSWKLLREITNSATPLALPDAARK